jgi:hypothetical protein
MEQSNKELIKEIADLFEDYEESYVPGEWESFQKHKKKKYPFFPQWLKVAAVLFLIVSVWPFHLKDLIENEVKVAVLSAPQPAAPAGGKLPEHGQLAENKSKGAQPQPPLNDRGGMPAKTHFPAADRMPALAAVRTGNVDVAVGKGLIAPGGEGKSSIEGNGVAIRAGNEQLITTVKEKEELIAKSGRLSVPLNSAVQKNLKDTLAAVPGKAKLSTSEFLLAESKTATQKEKKKDTQSKWDFGLQVMPTATRSNMNVGAGLVTAYRISDKFSLSSGISVLQLGSAGNVPAAAPGLSADVAYSSATQGFVSADRGRQLLSVAANIKAIDIPLGLVYQVNKHYYTSAGISYFNVLSEQRNNTYSQTQTVSRTTTDPVTGALFAYKALETQEVAEPASGQLLKGNSYIGFFNFSIGRRQAIFKQYDIQIEPFIKVPIGKLSAQDLNLINSGVKFQFSF